MSIFGIIAVVGVVLILVGSASCVIYEIKTYGFDMEDFLEKLIVIGIVCILMAFLLLMITYLGGQLE